MQKILAAINSNIEHREVGALKVAFAVFLLAQLAVSIFSHLDVEAQFGTVLHYMAQNQQWVQDQFFLSNLMHLSYNLSSEVNVSASRQSNLEYALNYKIKFDPEQLVSLEETCGKRRRVRLNEAMMWVQGYLVNFFQQSGIGVQDGLMLRNYYEGVYPAM